MSLLQREALLHTSGSYLRHSSGSAQSTATMNPAEASIRNARLLKDIENLNQDLKEELNTVPSPKFVTLQNNYWSMVRGLLPLWEQSLSGASSNTSSRQQQQQGLSNQEQGQRSLRNKSKGKSVTYSRATKRMPTKNTYIQSN
ncbi:hypothetical protein ACOMHN_044876 [Nucella lapillus]